ncbi:MAG: rhomboid family intramembrane serine protease [Terriglobales bacterium]
MLPIPYRNSNSPLRLPWVTFGLIGINLAVFFYELYLGSLGPAALPRFLQAHGLVPVNWATALAGGNWSGVIGPLLVSLFLHAGWLHLLGNLWMLYLFGFLIEDLLGPAGYLIFYLGCGMVAGVAQILADSSSNRPIVGASGAIAGVLGAAFVRFPRTRIRAAWLVPTTFRVIQFNLSSWLLLGMWFLGEVGDSLMDTSGGGVAVFAHIGGFLVGVLLSFIGPVTQVYPDDADVIVHLPPPIAASKPTHCRECGQSGFLADGLCHECWRRASNPVGT